MKSKDQTFNYDSIAAEYASKVDSAPYNALYERPAMLSLLPNVEGLRILDAGCGSGWYAEKLLERGASVEAIDASASMVDFARARLSRLPHPLHERVSLQVGDLAATLPFPDGTFSGAISPLVLHYLRDWRPALREIHRVLAGGGWLQFSTHHPAADAALFETKNYFATEYVTDHWDWVGEVRFYRRSLTEIFASLRDAGFVVEQVVEPYPTEEFRVVKPESYLDLLSRPQFLILVVRKP